MTSNNNGVRYLPELKIVRPDYIVARNLQNIQDFRELSHIAGFDKVKNVSPVLELSKKYLMFLHSHVVV